MAKVFLRVYNREIESMIEGGQLDEAVAHCQHILKTFPMHIDTYRLLGKAFLEARRYSDAADIFQRVLMAVPDDFVSHVGMSIIRDDENVLDDAIWHMERAFEVQPSNSAIQGELRRLYGRRDGVEPSKIRLSRDALANMYSQGELFNQAIAEIRSVLAEDTNRPDLQVMLARAYYRSGQKVEAAEMAATLLKKYPYCMDSLRVLADVLPGSARAENTQVYRQRLQMLDPYSSFAINSVFASDQVVDSAVSLERLEYRSGSTSAASQPDWASSLGIKLDDEKRPEPPPEWLRTADAPGRSAAYAAEPSGPEAAPATAGVVEGVPDWMHTAGWQESSETTRDGFVDSGEAPPAESIAKADIPDWLKSMAPAEVTEGTTPAADEPVESLPVGGDGIPDWLKPTGSTAAAAGTQGEAQNPAEPQPASGEDVPDWLKSIAPASSDVEAHEEATQPVEPQLTPEESQLTPVEPQPVGEDATPAWLKPSGEEEVTANVQVEPQIPVEAVEEAQGKAQQPVETPPGPAGSQPEAEEVVPDWLKSMVPTEETAGEVQGEAQQPVETQIGPVGPQPEAEEVVPEWLKSMVPTEETAGEVQGEAQQPVETQPGPAEPQLEEEAGVPDWLRSMAPTEETAGEVQGEAQQPVETQPGPAEPQPEAEAGVPDWLKSIAPAETTNVGNVIPEPAPASAETPAMETGPGSATLAAQAASAVVLPGWQAGMGSRANAAAMAAKATEQAVTAEPPVSGIPVPPEPVDQTPVKSPASTAGTGGETFQPTGEVKPLNIEDDALGWLESLAAKQGARPEELLTNPQTRSAEMPDWLRQPGEEPVDVSGSEKQESLPAELPEETPAQPVDQPVSGGDDTMAWLDELAADQGAKPDIPLVSPIDDQGTLPDWIQEARGDQPVVPAPEETLPVTPEPPAVEDDISITTWLSKLDVNEASRKKSEEVTSETQPVAPADELPDWLKDIEKPAAPIEAPKADNDLPEWLRHPISSLEPEPGAPLPGLDSIPEPEPEAPTWMDENVPVAGETAPTMPGEWLPVDAKAAINPDSLPAAEPPVAETTPVADSLPAAEISQAVETTPVSGPVPTKETAPIPEPMPVEENLPVIEPVSIAKPPSFSVRAAIPLPTLKQTGMLSHIPARDKDAELLSSAQDVLDQDSLDDAMKRYTKLIKKGRLLDEVIHDLREAIYRYPVDVIVWQTLGDAYMRANRLQDALDAYTKAEELLR